jgi:hypothetical protein
MKLSLVLPASILATACSGGQAPPPVVPVAPVPVPAAATTTTTSACTTAEPTPVNVTVTQPPKPIDPMLAAAIERMPIPELTVIVGIPTSLKTIDGKPRLYGTIGAQRTEVTLPSLTNACEQTIDTAIQSHRPLELRGKGRMAADNVPGHGYVSAYDLREVNTCVTR